ncbi:MAG: proton-conducting transporter membrane subunit [Myxococcota bacterium]
MNSLLSALIGVAFTALLAVAFTARFWPRRQVRYGVMAGRIAAALGLIVAFVACLAVAIDGSIVVPLVEWAGWGLTLRFDPLSVTMLGLVSFVGVVIVRFSTHYLAGDPRQAVFVGRLCLTLAGVSQLVLAGNLLHLGLAWVATSLALQRLLLFYPERPRARQAARKKFFIARASDVCLLGALIALGMIAPSADLGELSARMQGWAEQGTTPVALHLAAVALVLAACFKSAQVPAHGWLVDVVETPTPVSALLHAGLINAGGFLVIRLADVVVLSGPAMTTLVVVGGVTAVVGSLVMLTQTRVKNVLAYSTVAQMGFMLLQCGLGAFFAALIHLVAHSLYKAHAFLSSGSAVQIWRARPPQEASSSVHGGLRLAVSMLVAAAIFVGVGRLWGFSVDHEPGVFVLGGVLALALAMWLAEALPTRRPLGTSVSRSVVMLAGMLGAVTGIAALYFSLQALARLLYGELLPAPSTLPLGALIAGALALVAFTAVVLLQWSLPRAPTSSWWIAAYVRVKNGFDLDTRIDQWLRSLSRPRSRPSSSSAPY